MSQQALPRSRSSSLSRNLIRLIRDRPISGSDRQAAALFLLDAVASMLAGRNSPPGRKLMAWAAEIAGNGSIEERLDAGRQALVMGALCHILEVDDLHRPSVTHPGCVVAPVVLALGRGRPGPQALDALLRGFEAVCRVGMAVGPGHYRIWHNTATCGPFGAAMAAADLLGLDGDATVDAFGNAGSQSAGLWQFLDTGAETKHLHAGRGAEAGLVAAQLARLGFTGAPQILEGDRGFFRATCPDPDTSRLLADADAPWQLTRTSIKPWPSCRHTHPAIDIALRMRKKMSDGDELIDPATITGVDVVAYPAALDLCDRPTPDSTYAAKFSLQHCVAAALADGKVDFSSFEPPARDRLADLRGLITLRAADPFTSNYPIRWGSRIAVTMRNGADVSAQTLDARGDPEMPMSAEELRHKAIELMTFGGVTDPKNLTDRILAMQESGARLPEIMALIVAP